MGLQSDQLLPFIPFKGFDNAKSANKLFVYGPSGCGKSRCIYEIIKDAVTSFRDIYVINPRHTQGMSESGRAPLAELFTRFGKEDAVVWDNFPDDIINVDIDTAKKILEELSSLKVKNLLVSLKPKYLEIYRDIPNEIFELYFHEITYDQADFRSIMKSYGAEVTQFKGIYNDHILKELDMVSKILWHKEPTPLTILDFYKETTSKKEEREEELNEATQDYSIDAIKEAEKLLRPMAYYERQFAHIISLEERQSDAEFLYTLRLCYELKLSRAVPLVEQLQEGIFGSINSSQRSFKKLTNLVFRRLSSWVYLSGQYYSMHDVSKDSVKFNDYVNFKITNYLVENLKEILPNDDNAAYSFGVFLGRNIQFVPRVSGDPFVPAKMYDYVKNNRYFQTGFGQGIAESFLSLEEDSAKRNLEKS